MLEQNRRKESRCYLRSSRRIKIGGEEIMVEIIESESVASELGNVVAPMQDLLNDPLDVGSVLPLDIHEEPLELLSRHVGAALGVLTEGILHLLRWLRLRHLKLPGEAEAQPVGSHLAPQ